MIEFRDITLSDRQWVHPLLQMSGYGSEEYCFGFMYTWKEAFNYQVGRIGDYLILRADIEGKISYLFPPGSGDISSVIEALIDIEAEAGRRLNFHTVLYQQVKLMQTLFPGKFEFKPLEDYYDYVYDSQSLITLTGKKLHAKRNHINRFKQDNPDWSYEPISLENLAQVIDMSREWCIINDCESTKSGHEEACAVRRTLEEFFALQCNGGAIRAGGRIIAFSIGEPLNHDTYLVHIEKAFGDIQGAYAIINQQFAFHNCQNFLYINREDDSGQPGLRKAKQSYHPVFLAEKYSATLV